MAEEAENDTTARGAGRRRSFWRRWIIFPLLLILGAAFLAFWLQRETIAGNVIDRYLRSHHIAATYRIEHIGGTRQVLSHIVVGNPQHPDLTVERAEVVIRYRLGFPAIARVVLTRPRLYGTYHAGKLSLGALDPLIFPPRKPKQPFELPDFGLEVHDGRALLQTDFGPVGIAAAGKGHLRGGFAGELAATAPKLRLGTCTADGTTLYGKLGIDAERPTFAGPLRLQSLDCGDGSVRLRRTTLIAELRLDRDFDGGDGTFEGNTRAAGFAAVTADAMKLRGKASFRNGEFTASYDIDGTDIAHPQLQLASLTADGSIRAGRGFEWVRVESGLSGNGLRPGAGLDDTLEKAAESAGDTLLGAVLRKFRGAILREANGSSFAGQANWRKTGSMASLVVPQASVTGGSGQRILALSRFQYGGGPTGAPRLLGNFTTGGRDLPRIDGRIEERGNGGFAARLAMATYQAGRAAVAVPELAIVSNGTGIGFSGRAIVSGDLPGGHTEGLLLPVSGNWSAPAGFALWRACTKLTFDSLRFANLTFERHGLTVCPAKGQPIVRVGEAGLRVAAGLPSLDLSGRLGTTPVAIRSGPIGFAYPGTLAARQLLVTLGPRETATSFAVRDLTAKIGPEIAGRFDGADAKLFSVPLNILGAAGRWDYTDGRLTIAEGAFRLADRQEQARFQPLVARGATLAVVDNAITAEAVLREPTTDREVTRVDLRHDLASGRGHAALAVPGIVFDGKLQPQARASDCLTPGNGPSKDPPGLSCLALGVVSGVSGTVTGEGRIAWDENRVTSSGQFSSRSLDFDAAFGPVKGASGKLVFTDLLGLTTAPNQIFHVASVNPGIEVNDGEVSIQLSKGQVLQINWGKWPFMGGTLTMRPVTLNLGVSEQRTYLLAIEGLQAAQFVQRMELENISATGVFDGEVPLIFDAGGNGRLVGGHLESRGGGNVSYVGALTYKDLSPMANMAFEALRSLDYDRMTVAMDGPLTGEIVTRVRFDGVSQGRGAKQNFITRRIARLPFRFVVTVTAPFYQLITNIRAMYDPTMIRNPGELAAQGLLLDENGNLVPAGSVPSSPAMPAKPTPDEAAIQRRESEIIP
jgi:hypothetical protein